MGYAGLVARTKALTSRPPDAVSSAKLLLDARLSSQHSLAASALALGILVRVLPPELPLAESHFLAWSGAALDKPLGRAFRDWIIGESRRFDRDTL